MEHSIHNLIENAKVGEAQTYKNLSVFPVSFVSGNKEEYISLDKALTQNYIKINEVSESGRVNTLFVENISDHRVLMLDGEELVGAKQNRVLNTTILVEKQSKIEIPVSCVESGRWNYERKDFKTSDRIMSSFIKSRKMEDVNMRLNRSDERADYSSDQGRVWSGVDELLHKRKTYSHSSAMSEAFESSKDKLTEYLKHFKVEKNQNGLLVVINGKIIGFEYISKLQVFLDYFPKLMRGFAIDAIDEVEEKFEVINSEKINQFIAMLKESSQSTFKSIGLGVSFRFDSKSTIAAVLVENNEVIHLSQLYRENPTENIETEERSQRPRRSPYEVTNTIRRKKHE